MRTRPNTRAAVDRTGNSFCGPLVLAAIMGCTTAEAAAKARAVCHTLSRRPAVKGMYNDELTYTLMQNGFRVIDEPLTLRYRQEMGPRWGGQWMSHDWGQPCVPFTLVKRYGPTLAEWCRKRRDQKATYVVVVANHYVLICGRKFVDTYTKGEWVFLRSAPHRRKRVKAVFRVERRA